jgi:hypothetical protein
MYNFTSTNPKFKDPGLNGTGYMTAEDDQKMTDEL